MLSINHHDHRVVKSKQPLDVEVKKELKSSKTKQGIKVAILTICTLGLLYLKIFYKKPKQKFALPHLEQTPETAIHRLLESSPLRFSFSEHIEVLFLSFLYYKWSNRPAKTT